MPTPLRRPRGRRRSALVSVATLTPALVLLTTLGAVPQAAQAVPAPDPVLELVVPDELVVDSSGKRVYSDLGIALENTGGPLEIWLTRGEESATDLVRFGQSIEATTRDSEGNEIADIPVAPGTTLDGLQDLVTLSFEAQGRTTGSVRDITSGVTCLGGEGSQRISPDGPAVSPYPRYCPGYSTFGLGSVQGLPGGWGASIFGPYSGLRIPQGRWKVTVTMDPEIGAALGVPDLEKTIDLRVRSNGRARHGQPGPSTGPDEAAPTPSDLRSANEVQAPPDDYPLPDLRSLPAFGMDISGDGNFLRFSATVWNAGNTPLVVDGFRRKGEDVMDGYQYYIDKNGDQLPSYTSVGEFEWDRKPTHQHWHFRSFARYSLVEHGAEAEPGEPGHHHVRSRKEAFCLANTDAVDLTGEGAAWNVENTDLSTACGDYSSRSIREVLDPGWGDTYAQFRAGQSFNLKGLEKGCYDIVVEGNPVLDAESGERTLFERDTTNNVAVRTVKITGPEGARRLQYTSVGIVQPGLIGGEYRDVVTADDLDCEAHSHP